MKSIAIVRGRRSQHGHSPVERDLRFETVGNSRRIALDSGTAARQSVWKILRCWRTKSLGFSRLKPSVICAAFCPHGIGSIFISIQEQIPLMRVRPPEGSQRRSLLARKSAGEPPPEARHEFKGRWAGLDSWRVWRETPIAIVRSPAFLHTIGIDPGHGARADRAVVAHVDERKGLPRQVHSR